jgi:hypothetical protein
MATIFGVVAVAVVLWIGTLMIGNCLHPAKPETAAEHLEALSGERDHSVTPHIAQLGNATANVRTAWSKGSVRYDLTLLEAQQSLVNMLDKDQNYSFILTWYESDKPVGQILVPFSDMQVKGAHSLNAKGQSKMPLSIYENIYTSNSWDLNWGPVNKSKRVALNSQSN